MGTVDGLMGTVDGSMGTLGGSMGTLGGLMGTVDGALGWSATAFAGRHDQCHSRISGRSSKCSRT